MISKLLYSYDPKSDGITQSFISAFLCCRRRFLYMMNRWRAPDEPLFGNLCHHVLDGLYSAKKVLNDALISKLVDDYKPIYPVRQEDLEVERAKCFGIMRAYLYVYHKDFESAGIRKAEGVFQAGTDMAKFLGKIDLEFHDKQKKVWLMEHKTRSVISEDRMMLQLSFDFQNLLYMHCRKINTGVMPIGVIYNVIRNPQTRKSRTPKELADHIYQEARKDPAHYFKRYEIKYSQAQYNAFWDELFHIVNDIGICLSAAKLQAKPESVFYKNPYACQTPYACDYLEACASFGKQGNYIQSETLFPELGVNNAG